MVRAREAAPAPYREERIRSFDGTMLCVQSQGEGAPLVLANGLGGSFVAWRRLLDELGPRRVLSWDYRGLYRSGPPAEPDALAVPHHARDLLAVMDHARVERAVLAGWSMGCQVILELCRRHADRVAGLVFINGTFGRPFDSAAFLPSRVGRHAIPPVVRLLGRQARLTGALARRGARIDQLVPVAQRLGLVAGTIDVAAVRELARDFADLDFATYMRTMELLGRHDAADVLPTIRAPTLIIAGEKDVITPPRKAREMQRRIPDARLRVLPGGTHYTPVEMPDLVADVLARFLSEIGW